jgi:hypothetical protein
LHLADDVLLALGLHLRVRPHVVDGGRNDHLVEG